MEYTYTVNPCHKNARLVAGCVSGFAHNRLRERYENIASLIG